MINPFGDVGLEFTGYKKNPNDVIEFFPKKWPSNVTLSSFSIQFRNLSSGEEFSPVNIDVQNLSQAFEWSPMFSDHPLGLWEVEAVGHITGVGFRTAKYRFWVQ